MFQLDSDLYNKSRQMGLSERLGNQQIAASQQDMEVDEEKIKQDKVEKAVQYLGMATPENWSQIRQQAIAEGLGNEQVLPQQYDENWIAQTRAAFEKASSQPSSAIQNFKFSEMLGSDPERQRRFDEMARASRVMDAGGQIIQVNPFTGQATTVAPKTVSPDQQPELKGRQEEEKAIGDAKGRAAGAIEKKIINAPQVEAYLKQAELLLPNATSGGAATIGRDAAGFFGEATDESLNDSQLDVIGAALTSGVPRMEGPQSNYDVALYQQAAGDLANSKKPRETRLAAIKTIREINNKYAQQDGGPGAPIPSAAPPIQSREAGRVYDTPKGPMTWTGTGWLPAN